MIPIEKIALIIKSYEILEKELASEIIDKRDFVSKSKEYSNIGEIINDAKTYVKIEEDKKDLEKIVNEKDGDVEFIKLAEVELIELLKKKTECEKE